MASSGIELALCFHALPFCVILARFQSQFETQHPEFNDNNDNDGDNNNNNDNHISFNGSEQENWIPHSDRHSVKCVFWLLVTKCWAERVA